MGQDLRELFKKHREEQEYSLTDGHEARFLSKLDEELPEQKKKSGFGWWRIAASIVVLLGIGTYFFTKNGPITTPDQTIATETDNGVKQTTISFGDLSPELKQVEDYYVATINYELSNLEISEGNQEVVDSYLKRLEELNKEYQELTKELNEVGPNDQTIEAAIRNLQLRLDLMQKLKSKLNQLKSSKNEQESTDIV